MTEVQVPEDTHQPVWMKTFSELDRQTQMSDDSLAWRHVTGLLLLVVAIGLVIALTAVFFSA